jgi:hypothetical protein
MRAGARLPAIAAYMPYALADCTHPRPRRPPLAPLLLVALALAIALAAWPGRALADGDPASDVLTETPVYFPADGSIPAAQQVQLLNLVRESSRRGYPIRVALIVHQTDLGSIGALWNKPNVYSGFLGTELSLVFHGTVLIVMPNGYGVDVVGEPGAAAKTLAAAKPLIDLAPPGASGQAVADSAITAVRRIASAAGVQLSVPRATAVAAARSGGVDVVAWAVLAAGVALLAAAWAASVRARPVRRRVASLHDGT